MTDTFETPLQCLGWILGHAFRMSTENAFDPHTGQMLTHDGGRPYISATILATVSGRGELCVTANGTSARVAKQAAAKTFIEKYYPEHSKLKKPVWVSC